MSGNSITSVCINIEIYMRCKVMFNLFFFYFEGGGGLHLLRNWTDLFGRAWYWEWLKNGRILILYSRQFDNWTNITLSTLSFRIIQCINMVRRKSFYLKVHWIWENDKISSPSKKKQKGSRDSMNAQITKMKPKGNVGDAMFLFIYFPQSQSKGDGPTNIKKTLQTTTTKTFALRIDSRAV